VGSSRTPDGAPSRAATGPVAALGPDRSTVPGLTVASVREPELYTVAPDEVVVTFVTEPDETVTTRVGDHEITTAGPFHVARVTGLSPATRYPLAVVGVAPTQFLPAEVTTLPAPAGARLATFVTANDVHFGETVCGVLGGPDDPGPFFRANPGEEPYPEIMNRAAIDEIADLDPDAVVVKGDLTNDGTDKEYDAFLAAYGRFGARLHHVRGNHDAMTRPDIAVCDAPFAVELPGVTLAVLDTVIPGTDKGRVTADQVDWLDDRAAASDRPVLVFGHHHPWDPSSRQRNAGYFGINPDDSEALVELIGRRPAIAGYFAGHTHRNRVRRFPSARDVPIVEVACVKDYPGAWAEYRVHEGGYTQVGHRIGAPPAMAWSEKTRVMYGGFYRDYALGDISDRNFTQQF
jgi:3',5'-cyclic-AMP phosphodiesterase